MSNVVEKTAGMLMAQLERLDALAVAAGDEMAETVEKLKAECERSKAVNDTARNIISLGDLHLRAEMLRAAPERPFSPGLMFADGEGDGLRPLGHAPSLPAETAQEALPGTATAVAQGAGREYRPFGGRTKINEMGEFVTDDGLDAFTGGVDDRLKLDKGNKVDWASKEDVKRYNRECQAARRAKKRAQADE